MGPSCRAISVSVPPSRRGAATMTLSATLAQPGTAVAVCVSGCPCHHVPSRLTGCRLCWCVWVPVPSRLLKCVPSQLICCRLVAKRAGAVRRGLAGGGRQYRQACSKDGNVPHTASRWGRHGGGGRVVAIVSGASCLWRKMGGGRLPETEQYGNCGGHLLLPCCVPPPCCFLSTRVCFLPFSSFLRVKGMDP